MDNLEQVDLWLLVWRRVRKRLAFALYQHRWNVLVVVAVGGAGFFVVHGLTNAPSAEVGVLPIAVNVQQLEPQGDSLPLILIEKDGPRQLIIRDLESTEARVIARQQGIVLEGEQPQAYDLMRELIQQIGGRVDHVIVADGDRGMYSVRIVLSVGGEARTVRAKPADAVALALKIGAPLVLAAEAVNGSGTVRKQFVRLSAPCTTPANEARQGLRYCP
jgi:bifunctional DNase/RNase